LGGVQQSGLVGAEGWQLFNQNINDLRCSLPASRLRESTSGPTERMSLRANSSSVVCENDGADAACKAASGDHQSADREPYGENGVRHQIAGVNNHSRQVSRPRDE